MAGFEIIEKENAIRINKFLQPTAVYVLLLAVFATYVSVFEMDVAFLPMSLMLVLSTVSGYYVQFLKWNIKRGILIFAIVVAVGAGVWKYQGQSLFMSLYYGSGAFVNGFIKLYNAYYGATVPVISQRATNSEILWVLFLIQFFLGVVVSFVIRKGKGLFWVMVVALTPVILAAIVGRLPDVEVSLELIAAVIFYVICYKNQDGKIKKKEIVLAGICLSAIFGVSLVLMPILENYVDAHNKQYENVRNIFSSFPNFDFMEREKKETKGVSDYSEGGVGKGDFTNLSQCKPSGKREMVIKVTEKPKESVYLRAYAAVEYTSDGWQEMSSYTFSKLITPFGGDEKKRQLLSEPFQRMTGSSERVKKQHISIDLSNAYASKDYAYTPYYALISDDDEVVLDTYVRGTGDERYEYDYYWRSDVESLEETKLGEASALWGEYQAFVREEYLDYPKDLDALKRLCGVFEQNSKKELARCIDDYFLENLFYSYYPGKCPENKDFIEYFLFDNHKGFCVHFATAATIMYRMCGYPSRYVEGYMIQSDVFKRQSDGTYKAYVTDKMAHAWSEVFDDEKGWQVMEHTLRNDGEEGDFTENVTFLSHETETTAMQREEQNTENEVTSPETTREEMTVQTNTSGKISGTDKMEEEKHSDKMRIVLRVIAAIFFAIILLVLQMNIRRIRKIRSFRKVKQNSGITNIYNAVYEICVFQGLKSDAPSDRQVLEAMKTTFLQLEPEEWDWMYECAEKAAFTRQKISRSEQRQMYRLYQKFRRKILSEMPVRKKILFLCIWAM